MKILIVGAGLGGLSAALAFARRGHEVKLFESRDGLSPTQGGINVRPAATRIMNTWGLQDGLERIAEPTSAFINRNLYTGKIANRTILVDATSETDWGTTRNELVRVLYQRAKEAGAEIFFGTPVSRVHDNASTATLIFADGREFEGDIIIAADGIRSRIRPQILADIKAPIDPIVSDITLYGVRIEGPDIGTRQDMQRFVNDADYVVSWIGKGAFVISRYNRTLSHARGLFGVQGQTDQKGLWDEEGDIQFLRDRFSTSCEDLRAMLSMANSCDRWRLAELPNLPRWTSKNGRIVLLGDSAHGMEPNAAHGFSVTIEDAGVLEYLISRDDEPIGNIPAITREWEKIRKPRVERIKAWAKENTSVFVGDPPKSRVLRESGEGRRISLKDVKPNMHGHFDSREFLKWTLDYDAVAEAKKVVGGSARANL